MNLFGSFPRTAPVLPLACVPGGAYVDLANHVTTLVAFRALHDQAARREHSDFGRRIWHGGNGSNRRLALRGSARAGIRSRRRGRVLRPLGRDHRRGVRGSPRFDLLTINYLLPN